MSSRRWGHWLFGLVVSAAALNAAVAAEQVSDFQQALGQGAKVHTRESNVDINGVQYRKIEYRGRFYYLRLLAPAGSQADLNLYCEKTGPGAIPFDQKARVHGEVQLTERTAIFVEGLQDACAGGNDGTAIVLPAAKIGFTIPNTKGSALKDRQVYFDLLSRQLGFRGNW